MRKRRVVPNCQNYNLLLRAVRDCGLGPISADMTGSTVESLKVLPATSVAEKRNMRSLDTETQLERTSTDSAANELMVTENVPLQIVEKMTNVLNPRANVDEIVSETKDVTSGTGRMHLLGDVEGVLSHMARDGTKPDIKTFTMMLDCIPRTAEAEQQLLTAITRCKVSPDINLYNMLIRRRAMHNDDAGARVCKPRRGILCFVAGY